MTDFAITTEGLSKRFANVTALDGVDLTVETGSAFGLLGPNGAGKTTAVRILTTILRPDSAPPAWAGTTSSARRRRYGPASAWRDSTRRWTRT